MINHHFSSGLYAKEIIIPKGSRLIQHKHNYDHLSVLAKGKVIVVVDDAEVEVNAPACINIEANKHHGILALEDCVWYCIHATAETDVDKIDKVLIKE
jgi:quercetin dioxygenase-like cupin family protein